MLRACALIILSFSLQAFAEVPDINEMRKSVVGAAQVMQSQDSFSERMDSIVSLKSILGPMHANNSDITMKAHEAQNFYYAVLPVLEIQSEKDCRAVMNQVSQGRTPEKKSHEHYAMRLLGALCN